MVRLKNSRVYDWTLFASHLRRAGTQQLDMRKMLFVASREDTWAKVAHWIEQPELIRNATHPAKVWTFYNSFFVAVTAASTIGQLPLFVVR